MTATWKKHWIKNEFASECGRWLVERCRRGKMWRLWDYTARVERKYKTSVEAMGAAEKLSN